ncbi:UNKNOWN [Stylonychia lemnae]|uniref:Uncharacterized protein n=1 Tax=Stylonychia lemnae TaxID=5949 RepID=A0A078B9G0_STYLE|nr:UNKNOWN [Stylonychia lemnae]|eukprot:CDW91044.1 UNKNOWN [Stylonychia lemnae]
MNSQFVCEKKDSEREIKIVPPEAHAINLAKKDKTTFEQKLKEFVANDLIGSFNWKETFQGQNSISQLESINTYGVVLIAYGNCLVLLKDTQNSRVFIDVQDFITVKPFYYKFSGIIKLVKVAENAKDKYLGLQIDQELYILDTAKFLDTPDQGSKAFSTNEASIINKLKIDINSYVRQLSFNPDDNFKQCLITTNIRKLVLFDLVSGATKQIEDDVTSAIFNKSGEHVIASFYREQDHLEILDKNSLQSLSKLTISIGEDCKHDKYRVYQLCDYFGDNLIIGGCGFVSPDQIADNFGFLLQIWIGQNLTPQSTMNQIKSDRKLKIQFLFDQQPNNDEDPTSFKLQYASKDPLCKNVIGVLGVSQCKEPIFFSIEEGVLKYTYEFVTVKFMVTVPGGFDEIANLGQYQGFAMIKFRPSDQAQTFDLDMGDHTIAYMYPPLIIQQGIDGELHEGMIFIPRFEQDNLLVQTKPIPKSQSVVQSSPQAQVQRQNEEQKKKAEEEKKQQQPFPQIQPNTSLQQPLSQTQNTQSRNQFSFSGPNPTQLQQNSNQQNSFALGQDQNQIKHSNTFSTQQQKLPVQQLQHSQTSTMFGSLSQSPIQTDPFKDGTFATPQTNKNSQTYLQSSSQTGAFALGQKLIQPQLKSSTKIIGSQQTLPLQNQPSNFSFSQPQIQADQAQNKSQAIPIAKSQLAPQQLTQQQQIQQQNNTQQSIPLSQQPIQVQISQQAIVQSKQKTPIQVQIEDFEKKMTDHYNKEVVDLLKQVKDNLPNFQSLKDDLRANNIKWDIFYQLLNNSKTFSRIQNSQYQNKQQIKHQIENLRTQASQIIQIREQFSKTKQEIRNSQYKDDFGLSFQQGKRLKDLIFFEDSKVDKKLQFNKAQKQKLATIVDKALDILERIKPQKEKSLNSQKLNEPTQIQCEKVKSMALRQQAQNYTRNKFLSRGVNPQANDSDSQQNLTILKEFFEIKKDNINETIEIARNKQQKYIKQFQKYSEKINSDMASKKIYSNEGNLLRIIDQPIQLTQIINSYNSKLYKDQ